MPQYKVSLRQALQRGYTEPGFRKWSNSFNLVAASATAAAAAIVVGWANYLRFAARDLVWAYEAYATSAQEGDADYAIVPVALASQRGAYEPGPGPELYWPDACLSVDLAVAGSRPDRKFWRPFLRESDFTNGAFTNTALAGVVEGAFNDLLANLQLVDSQGNPIDSASVRRATMRRMGRTAAYDVPVPPPHG